MVEQGAPLISVCIVCRNEADRIGPCLESVRWADEIVVIDLCSEDGSGEVARQYGARVIEREPLPIVEPLRNELAAVAKGDWLLALDPDERVSPALAEELRRLAAEDYDAVVIPRMNYDLGFPPSNPLHRYEPQLRMYRPDRVTWPLMPNALPVVAAERKYVLPQRDELVIHHDRSRNIPEVLDRVLRYAPAQAQAMVDAGQRFTAGGMITALGLAFYKQFLEGQPWRDGVPGLLRAGILVAFKFYVWAAFWQLSGVGRTAEDDGVVRRLGYLMEGMRRMAKVYFGGVGMVRWVLRR
jgi:hypothetical protein